MSKIRNKDTKPELIVRKILTEKGIRYRLHKKELPGKPDVVIIRKRIAIFVNGCFWHQHKGCKKSVSPKTNKTYWRKKLKGNVETQKRNIKELKKAGWKIIIIWECETKKEERVEEKLKNI